MARRATVADEVTLVLDNAENRNSHLLVHRNGLVHVLQRHLLWRRHDHGSVALHALRERQGDVTGSWWHVEE